MNEERKRKLGSSLLALGCIGVLGAPLSIVRAGVDPSTRVGRHLIAGALALASVSVLEMAIVVGPLRRGERWAWWAALSPFVIVAVPVLVMDLLYVSSERLFRTIAPQLAGLLAGALGLWLSRIAAR